MNDNWGKAVRDGFVCSHCGAHGNDSVVVEAHARQSLERDETATGDTVQYRVVAEWDDLEMRCGVCGGVWWTTGPVRRLAAA